MPATRSRLRRVLAPLFLTTAALAAAAPSALAAGAWSSPVPLTGPGSDAAGLSAFVAPDGRTLVTYAAGGAVRLAAGNVAGAFTPAVTLASAPENTAPSAALGADGTLAVTWSAGGETHVSVVRPGTGPVESVLPGPGAANVDAAVGPDGTVTVAYRTKAGPSSYALVAASAPPGGGFGPAATLASGAAPIQCVDTAVAPSGATAVAFCRQTPAYRAHVTVRPAGAAEFEAPQKLSEGAAPDIGVRVAAQTDGAFVVAWSNPEGAAYAVRPAGASVFGAPGRLSPAGEAGFAVDLVSGPGGGAAATWTSGQRIETAALSPGTAAFGAAVPVADVSNMIVPDPRIAVAPDGATTVVVIDPTTGEVRAGAPGGTALPIGYSLSGQATAWPAVAASADRTVAAWRDASGALVAATRSAQAPPATDLGTRPAGPDRRRPKVTVLRRTSPIRVTTRTRQVGFRVRCDEPCSFSGTAVLRTQRRGQRRQLAPLVPLRAGRPAVGPMKTGTRTVTFRLGTFARRNLLAALRAGHGAQLYVDLTATDAASNATRTTWRVSLRGPRRR